MFMGAFPAGESVCGCASAYVIVFKNNRRCVRGRQEESACQRLHADHAAAIARALRLHEYPASEGVGNMPEEFDKFVRVESAKYARAIKDAGVKVE
jgi:hypothetical protein